MAMRKKNPSAKKQYETFIARVSQNRKRITKIVFIFIIILVIGYFTGHTRYVGSLLVCGKLPVITSDFMAARSYTVPERNAYYVTPGSGFYCTAEEAEAASYHDTGY